MKGFIEVEVNEYSYGYYEMICLNISQIQAIYEVEDKCHITMSNGKCYKMAKTYEEVKAMIEKAVE